ncbi:MAG: hypothetical protein HAW67_07230, partial [Endozoicomonadaceae bacterium]|nr:hypothetical protein [Endozoicomonadaceae bacterium]
MKWLLRMVCIAASTSFIVAATAADTGVIGQFADQGYVGTHARTLTLLDAQNKCLNDSLGSSGSDTFDQSFQETYKGCMKQYVPFRDTTNSNARGCDNQSVVWGQCGSDIMASLEGTMLYLKNTLTTNDYEGSAAFRCKNEKWEFVGGGCGKTVKPCEANKIVSWPVTSPLWADNKVGSQYLDKYGDSRHTPKTDCVAKMPYALSGKYLAVKPTRPETDSNRYDFSQTAPYRCFNKEWLNEPVGAGSCKYIPKTCAGKKYQYNGCEFDLRAGAHDSIQTKGNPIPQNSDGSVEAYCWDGNWEIKSHSCELSCGGNVKARSWKGDDSRSCSHSQMAITDRVAPNTSLYVENEDAGMSGGTSYSCTNGDLSVSGEACEPKGCDTFPEKTWGLNPNVCWHSTKTASQHLGGEVAHGKLIALSNELGAAGVGSSGAIQYQCDYGVIRTLARECSVPRGGICKTEPYIPPVNLP